MSAYHDFLWFQQICHFNLRDCNSQFDWHLQSRSTKHWDNLQNCVAYIYTLIASRMGNHMLPVPESAIQTISLSTRKLELPRILCIHKYWKIKHIRNMHFLFFPPLNKQSQSNAWPGTASVKYIYYIYDIKLNYSTNLFLFQHFIIN